MIQYPAGVRDRVTRVLESGSGGDPVVFCHGLAARADRWRHNLDVVAGAGYHAYAYDHPGHGLATKGPDYDYTVPGFADFLESFLELAGVDETYLVGTSFGGATAGAFTARHPERVKGLILVGAVGLAPMPQETRQRIRDRVGDASVEGVRTKLTTLLIDASLATEDFVREEHMINSSPGAKEAFDRLGEYMAEAVERDIVVERLAEVGGRVPVLLLWGELDRTFPVSVAEEARAKIPGANLALIRGAGHAPYYEKAEVFNGVLLDFLAGRYGTFRSDDVEYR
jgi:2-hydroxy-6-oxonona-2,4-dienedioate hydrolase